MRIGIIDCGTNTFNLLVADIEEGNWTERFRGKVSVKLGKGGFEDGFIQDDRLARGIDALRVHHHAAQNYEVDKIFAFGTSALREAKNAPHFLQRAKDLFGIEIQIIDGDREASLIFKGVKQTLEIGDAYVTIIDIGGGSTEFIIANKDGVAWKTSLPLGVSRIYDHIQPEDPLSKENTAALKALFDERLASLKEALQQYPSKTLIGSSGSFDTLVDMSLARKEGAKPDPHSNVITMQDFRRIHDQMIQMDRDARLRIKGMLPLRVDFMPLATHMIKYVLQLNDFQHIQQSSFALKEGAIQEALENL